MKTTVKLRGTISVKLRKTLLPLVIVSLGGAITIAGCTVSHTDSGMDANQIGRESAHDHADHTMSSDGIKDGVTISHEELRIQNIWARPAFKGANSAVYLNLHNHGKNAERFLGATSEFAKAVEIHEINMEGDLMIMSPVLNGIEIPANGSIELVSGGYHLMLIDLQSDLHEDDHFPLALQFEQSGQVIVDVLVAQP